MSTLMVTILLLLADGTPASHAYFQCEGIDSAIAGDDAGGRVEDPILLVDSRGAVILQFNEPTAISCVAEKSRQTWAGTIRFERDKQKIRIYLKGQT